MYKNDILPFDCHSGSSGIFSMASRKDSRRASLAGMTDFGFFHAFMDRLYLVKFTLLETDFICEYTKTKGG
jgi:hypothetical protein